MQPGVKLRAVWEKAVIESGQSYSCFALRLPKSGGGLVKGQDLLLEEPGRNHPSAALRFGIFCCQKWPWNLVITEDSLSVNTQMNQVIKWTGTASLHVDAGG